MPSRRGSGPDTEGGPPAYPCFLLSLLAPGVGQIAGGAPGRGTVLLALAAAIVALFFTGSLHLLAAGSLDGRDAAWLSAAIVLWLFAPYDAWFLVRERRNGMLVHLPRTPRIAFLAGILWGGAGHAYLGHRAGIAMLPATALLAGGLVATGGWPWLGVLALWNLAAAAHGYVLAVRRYHTSPEYRACQAELEAAPFASAQAPSPSLPFATLLAAFIAVMGGLLLQKTVADLSMPAPPRTGELREGQFIFPGHRLRMALPVHDWAFRTGQAPLLLTGRHLDRPLSFSLAMARAPLFGARDVVPSGALARFSTRQEAELAARLTGFHLLSRVLIERQFPGLRLVFGSFERGEAKLTAQEYLLAHDRIVVLTLAGPGSLGEAALGEVLDSLAAGVVVQEPQK